MVSTVDPSAERSHCEVPLRRYCEVPLRRCTSEELVGCCAAKTDACEPGLEMGQLPPSGKEIAASSHAEVMPDRCDQCPIHQDMLGLYLACSYKNGDDGKAQVQHQCISLSRPRPRVQSRGSVVRSLLQPAEWETADEREGWHHTLRPGTNLPRRLRAMHDER